MRSAPAAKGPAPAIAGFSVYRSTAGATTGSAATPAGAVTAGESRSVTAGESNLPPLLYVTERLWLDRITISVYVTSESWPCVT